SDLLAHDAQGVSKPAGGRRGARGGGGGSRYSRAAVRASASGQVQSRFPLDSGTDWVSLPVPSQGAGYRAALARPDADDSGRRGNHGGRLHGSRRNLGDEEGILRAFDE